MATTDKWLLRGCFPGPPSRRRHPQRAILLFAGEQLRCHLALPLEAVALSAHALQTPPKDMRWHRLGQSPAFSGHRWQHLTAVLRSPPMTRMRQAAHPAPDTPPDCMGDAPQNCLGEGWKEVGCTHSPHAACHPAGNGIMGALALPCQQNFTKAKLSCFHLLPCFSQVANSYSAC